MTNDEIDALIEKWQNGDSNDEEIDGLTEIVRELQVERENHWIVIDVRPYDPATAAGPFKTEQSATRWAMRAFELDIDELPDGIEVVKVDPPAHA